MKIYRPILIIFYLALILSAGFCNAAINVSPSTATVGQTVTVTVSGTFATRLESIGINFGDGNPTVSSPRFTTPGAHSFTATHSYSRPGTYTITGQTSVPGAPPETRSVTILAAAGNLPPGTVGEDYEYSLTSLSSSRSNRYRVTGSRLPPGLKLERNGVITGIPTKKGKYTFTVQITDQSGTTYLQTLILFVDPGNLILRVTPDIIDTTRGGGTNQKVTFTVIAPTVLINETIRSTRGEFVAGGRVLGYENRPMNINLNTHQPSASEKIKIPNNVLRAAQSVGTSKITYRRNFRSNNFDPGSGETKINMRTAASGQFRITKLRIFFEQNNRPLIVVERNSRDLTGVLKMHYNGSGTFKGFWKVDERIIQRVQKNMFYGKVLTLKTPNAPPLPTYSEGAHRLQFIITEPESAQQKIDFPEAIYHVEAKKAEFITPITLTTPENRAQIEVSGGAFTWTEPPRVATYLVEFFEADADEPFFTAYTKQGLYALPAKILSLKFIKGKRYSWHIRGIDSSGLLTAESPDRNFMLLE